MTFQLNKTPNSCIPIPVAYSQNSRCVDRGAQGFHDHFLLFNNRICLQTGNSYSPTQTLINPKCINFVVDKAVKIPLRDGGV